MYFETWNFWNTFYVFLKRNFKKRKKSRFWIFKKKRKKRILELWLLQPSLAFCFSLQPMTAYRPGVLSSPGRYAVIGCNCKLKQNANEGCNSCASLAGLRSAAHHCSIAARLPTTVANPHNDRSLGSKETHIQSHNRRLYSARNFIKRRRRRIYWN